MDATAISVRKLPAVSKWDELGKRAKLCIRKAEQRAAEIRAAAFNIVRDPQFQVLAICTSGGAVALGSVGGAFGLASGVVAGAGAGVLPALFTFGLSIPAGAIVGGGAGLCVGAGSGAIGGGAAGCGVYRYRVEIKDGVVYIKKKTRFVTDCGVARVGNATEKLAQTSKAVIAGGLVKVHFATAKAGELAMGAKSTVVAVGSDKAFQVTSASAVAVGAMGGVAGGAAGTLAGAAAGLVPAIFTFGLSIPLGATIGCGVGATCGSTAGALGGGAVGYGTYTRRKELTDCANDAWRRACTSAKYAKNKATDTACQLKRSMKSIVGGGTGGTA